MSWGSCASNKKRTGLILVFLSTSIHTGYEFLDRGFFSSVNGERISADLMIVTVNLGREETWRSDSLSCVNMSLFRSLFFLEVPINERAIEDRSPCDHARPAPSSRKRRDHGTLMIKKRVIIDGGYKMKERKETAIDHSFPSLSYWQLSFSSFSWLINCLSNCQERDGKRCQYNEREAALALGKDEICYPWWPGEESLLQELLDDERLVRITLIFSLSFQSPVLNSFHDSISVWRVWAWAYASSGGAHWGSNTTSHG